MAVSLLRGGKHRTIDYLLIVKIAPNTVAGLLVMIRVVETHDRILDGKPAEQLLTEIRDFAKRVSA
jgi:hypothetical protein